MITRRIACVLALCTFAAPGAGWAAPRQGWATADRLVDLQPNGVPLAADDPLARARIHEAFARWGIAYDEARIDVIRSLFTPDAEFVVTRGSSAPIARARGVDAIAQTVQSTLAQQGDQRRHAISNIVIDRLSRTDATAIAYGIVTSAKDQLSLAATVIYRADLRRGGDGVWRFTSFTIGMDDYAGPTPVVRPQ